MDNGSVLVLRLSGPLQSWGTQSRHNYRTTDLQPSKSGVVGILAAAQGLRRGDDVSPLVNLSLAVRSDQPGRILTDFHTVSTLDGSPLLASKVNSKGWQSTTTPKKFTYVTRRQYLEDATFVVFLAGDGHFLTSLAEALQHPAYPLALGRRSCVPSEPLVVPSDTGPTWRRSLEEVLRSVPWQAGRAARERRSLGETITVTATLDDPQGSDLVADVPVSFDPRRRSFRARRVTHTWVTLPTGKATSQTQNDHDPFALLGGA